MDSIIQHLDFEASVQDLELKIKELKGLSSKDSSIATEVTRLEDKCNKQLKQIYSSLTAWQTVKVARHPNRPHSMAMIKQLFTNFESMAGDRSYREDLAVIGGFAKFREQNCLVLGLEKGHDTQSRVEHNFGMARPEGYRKAVRLMRLAERFSLPVVCLVDTSGAYPGRGAEERGQAQAIAHSIQTCLNLKTPIIAVVIGEGGSGGAIALAVADRVLMMQHAVYSVISPEGCASILWRSAEQAEQAASAMKMTAPNLLQMGVADAIVEEPIGGAHRNPELAIAAVGDAIAKQLDELNKESLENICAKRQQRYLSEISA